jgi:hypothetical protein
MTMTLVFPASFTHSIVVRRGFGWRGRSRDDDINGAWVGRMAGDPSRSASWVSGSSRVTSGSMAGWRSAATIAAESSNASGSRHRVKLDANTRPSGFGPVIPRGDVATFAF